MSGSVTCGWNVLLEGRVPLCWAQTKTMWKILKIDGVSSSLFPSVRCTALLGLSPGLPGEVLLQRHHLPRAPHRRRPLPSLHTQMSLDLQLQVSALLDQRRRCSCRQRQQFSR